MRFGIKIVLRQRSEQLQLNLAVQQQTAEKRLFRLQIMRHFIDILRHSIYSRSGLPEQQPPQIFRRSLDDIFLLNQKSKLRADIEIERVFPLDNANELTV